MAQAEEGRKQQTMGRRLASVRVLHGLTQEEAAAAAGFSQPYLSLLENDNAAAPPLHTIAKLAELYKVSIDYLVNGEAA